MGKHILFPATIVFLLGAFQPVLGQKHKQGNSSNAKTDLKFLDDIIVDMPRQEMPHGPEANLKTNPSDPQFASKRTGEIMGSMVLETANNLQFKYALLLDMEVEQIQNLPLFKVIDEWFGTRYKLGGSTKNGIDCSAFMQVLFSSLYGITLPRTAREQFHTSRKISRTELREGDLVFFNTIGGVSHVGMYLQNNKFVHASKSGVTISDLYEDYWVRKFIGVGRIESVTKPALNLQP